MLGTAAHYTVLIVLVEAIGANAVLASSAGAITGALVNYFLNYVYTFQSTKKHHEALVKFLFVATIGFVVNGAMMSVLVELVRLNYLVSQILTTGVVLMWNFAGNRLWTFRESAS